MLMELVEFSFEDTWLPFFRVTLFDLTVLKLALDAVLCCSASEFAVATSSVAVSWLVDLLLLSRGALAANSSAVHSSREPSWSGGGIWCELRTHWAKWLFSREFFRIVSKLSPECNSFSSSSGCRTSLMICYTQMILNDLTCGYVDMCVSSHYLSLSRYVVSNSPSSYERISRSRSNGALSSSDPIAFFVRFLEKCTLNMQFIEHCSDATMRQFPFTCGFSVHSLVAAKLPPTAIRFSSGLSWSEEPKPQPVFT